MYEIDDKKFVSLQQGIINMYSTTAVHCIYSHYVQLIYSIHYLNSFSLSLTSRDTSMLSPMSMVVTVAARLCLFTT